FHVYTNNTDRQADEILSVKYEDGRWSKPYYDCGGGNIWMLTYTVPFFGFENGTYFFKGTSGIDIDLRRVDIDQCPQKNSPSGAPQPLNIFAGTDKCKQRTTECIPIPGLGFRRGSYRCICRKGYYFPDTAIEQKYFNGSTLEEEYEKLMMNEYSTYSIPNTYECLQCAEGCDSCEDASPCVAALNWPMRTSILVLACAIIGLLPPAAVFTFKYQQVKVVRAASPALLRVIALGAFCIYCTSVVMYPPPSLYSCTARIWLREIGFSLTYGALMLKTWRISVIFRVRSAKAVKITDAYLLKRLGVLCGFVGIALLVRTLVAPPVVIVGRTADNLKAFLCKTDWWDHTFTSMEVLFLAWGVRLCIMVRKAPSEFNESRFISMAIYNEFLLTCFLNVSMLFLQSPANPDLLYIIFFCHTQLTVTLLLALIFGSKVYLVFRGGGKHQDDPTGLGIKPSGAKFISRSHGGRTFGNPSSVTTSTAQLGANMGNEGRLTETEALEELKQLYMQLQRLYERIPQRGAAILTVASLMEACRCSSLKPPPSVGAPSPLKALTTCGSTDGGAAMMVGSGHSTDGTSPGGVAGVLRLDKSTNTNTTATIPNGEPCVGNGVPGGMLVASHTRITITDETVAVTSEQQQQQPLGASSTSAGARSIDGSDFRLDHQQLECMCSDSTLTHATDDPGDGAEAAAAAAAAARINGTAVRPGSCCCCCNCSTGCPSQHSPPSKQRVQQQQHNDSVINYSSSGAGAGPATSAPASTVNCNCKISAVSDVSGGAARPSTELVLSCQLSGGNRAGGRSAGCLSTLAQQQHQQQQQQQSRRQHHRASSTASSEYSERSTKAFESCDNLLHQHHRPSNHYHHQQQQPHHPPCAPHHQLQQQRQRQTSCSGDSLDNHDTTTGARSGAGCSNPCPRPIGAGGGTTDEHHPYHPPHPSARDGVASLEKFNKLHAGTGGGTSSSSTSSKIDSLQENFLMRAALTTALQNLENENRSRGLTSQQQQHQHQHQHNPTADRRSSVDTASELVGSFEEQLLADSSSPGHKGAALRGASESFESSLSSVSVAGDHHHLQQQQQQQQQPQQPPANAPVTVSSSSNSGGAVAPSTGTLGQPLTDGFPSGAASASRSNSSSSTSTSSSSGGGDGSSANTLEMVGGAGGPTGSPSTSATGSGSQGNAKKKKSPEKRLVIDLNDRSKYTEEVSV
uniref:G-protein coupled receptors family 3 profile domain-containing protein n=2 Tax=Anopheles albimanus TaxID=7167 RepID=A0A182FH55_ANOAL